MLIVGLVIGILIAAGILYMVYGKKDGDGNKEGGAETDDKYVRFLDNELSS